MHGDKQKNSALSLHISFSKKTIPLTLARRKKGKKGATIPYARTCYG